MIDADIRKQLQAMGTETARAIAEVFKVMNSGQLMYVSSIVPVAHEMSDQIEALCELGIVLILMLIYHFV